MKKKLKADYQKIPDRGQLNKLTSEELKNILEAHQLWLTSDGKEGVRANLKGLNLCQENLSEANLEQALLGGSDLEGANLYKASLRKSDLSQTNFRDADLREADLSESIGLQIEQLSRANLSNAKLTGEISKFNGLSNIKEASKNAQKVYLLIILLCLYSWLTMATTTSADLITDYPTFRLPIVNIPIHIVSFYICAPAIILCIYFYYHISMQRLWERLSAMPAFFPDGESLDKKVYPWLLTGLVRSYFHSLQTNKRLTFYGLQKLLSIASAWFIVPFTLYLFWADYLLRHEVIGTAWLLIILSASVLFCITSFQFARNTLKGEKKAFRSLSWTSFFVILFLAILVPISFGVIYGLPSRFASELGKNDIRILVPHIFSKIRYGNIGLTTAVILVECDLSIKPANWTGVKMEEIEYVKGAPLNGVNLRNAHFHNCFLVKADLRGADIRGACFHSSDLRKAHLERATLTKTQLSYADLSDAYLTGATLSEAFIDHAKLTGANLDQSDVKGANLFYADLQNAKIKEANLKGTNLSFANLKGANLDSSCLKDADLAPRFWGDPVKIPKWGGGGANLQGTNLNNADLQGANLIGVQGLTRDQIRKARNYFLAYYDEKMIMQLGFSKNHNNMIRSKNLRGVNLRGLKLHGVDLSGFELENADLRSTIFDDWYSKREFLFHRTSFQGANLKNADLRKANFIGANLRDANFTGAKLQGTILQGADLTGATGLTKEQIESAILNNETKLPGNL
jgi:uncharacterized protein YjbI with pentapeptide repeats